VVWAVFCVRNTFGLPHRPEGDPRGQAFDLSAELDRQLAQLRLHHADLRTVRPFRIATLGPDGVRGTANHCSGSTDSTHDCFKMLFFSFTSLCFFYIFDPFILFSPVFFFY